MIRNDTARIARGGLSLIALAAMLAACSGGQQDAGPQAEPNTAENAKAKPPEPVELVIALPGGGVEETLKQWYVEPIVKKFPHIKPKLLLPEKGVSIKEWVASGVEFDLVTANTNTMYAYVFDLGLEYDISGLIEQFKYDLNQLQPTIVETMRMMGNGKIFALPTSDSLVRFYYNKDIFDKFGVPYLRNGMTWDDIYELAVKLTQTDKDVQYRGFVAHLGSYLNSNQLSANPVDGKTNKALFQTDERWVPLVRNLERFFRIPGNGVSAADVFSMQNYFMKDQVAAMLVSTAQTMPTDLNWDYVQMPGMKERPEVASQNLTAYTFVTSMSKHKEEAFQALAYLTSKENQMVTAKSGFGAKSVLREDADVQQEVAKAPALAGKNVSALFPKQMAGPSVITPYNSIALSELGNAVAKVLTGETDVNSALREATELADKKIGEAKR